MDPSATAAIQSYGTPNMAEPTLIDDAMYRAMYEASIRDPETFWGEHGKRIDWIRPYSRVKNCSFAHPDVSIKWFEDGTLNVSANCIDRHLKERGDQVAIIWEPDDPSAEAHRITYRELFREVNIFANVLKSMGVSRGDRVTIYLPMIPEAAYAMLACARIGAIHSVVFAGFSPDCARGPHRRLPSRSWSSPPMKALRGGKTVKLKHNTDEALTKSLGEEKVIVIRRTGRVMRHACRARFLVPRARRQGVGPTAHRKRWAQKIRSSSSTPRARRERPRVWCTPPAAISSMPHDPSDCVRLSRRRRLLVHGGCRLGHRPLLYRLWSARQRRHHADVRGGAELSRLIALLAGCRQAQGQHPLLPHPRPSER